jgi:hypothetical protein
MANRTGPWARFSSGRKRRLIHLLNPVTDALIGLIQMQQCFVHNKSHFSSILDRITLPVSISTEKLLLNEISRKL